MIPDLIYFIQDDIPSAKIICEKYNELICVNITNPETQTTEGRIYNYSANNLRGYNFKRVDPHTYTKVIISNNIIGIKSDGSQEIFSYKE